MSPSEQILAVAITLAIFGVIIGYEFGIGNTFGQRCAAKYERDSGDWLECVDALAHGRRSTP